jgi:hypothetical protein
MFSEVVQRPTESAHLIGTLLGRTDLVRLETAEFEFTGVGTPYWLGERTYVDLLLRFARDDGGLQVVAIETKLADRFSTRRTQAMGGPSYEGLARHRPIWRDLWASLDCSATRQMTRCHALAQSVQAVDGGRPEEGAALLILVHPEDVAGIGQAQTYLDGLAMKDGAIATWDTFLDTARRVGAIDQGLSSELALRYSDMTTSGDAWRGLLRSRSRPGGAMQESGLD